ncbi:MAG: phosphoenolpyruvate--protein phosphotransferase [Clostridiaceae bacterium]
MKLTGTAVSGGIAIAPAFVYRPFTPEVTEAYIETDAADAAYEAFERTRSAVGAELLVICESFSAGDSDKADILRAHIEILNDIAITEEVERRIRSEHMDYLYAIETTFTLFGDMMASLDDPLLKERATDVLDVKCRLLCACLGVRRMTLKDVREPSIICAHDLMPSDTATLNRAMVAGIVTETGGITSHSAIIARSYGIPAVLGVEHAMDAVSGGDTLILDASAGTVIVCPAPEEMSRYTEQKASYDAHLETVRSYTDAVPVTTDGKRILVCQNIGSASHEELKNAPYVDGVGLFRTEFLYMQGAQLPGEETQYQAYKAVAETFGARQVILRTLDIGGDKSLSCLPLPKEDNPFLGIRALRLCFSHPELFRTQIRAILRASVCGSLAMMFPMVGTIDDIRRAKAVVEDVKNELRTEGIPFNEQIPIGIMIEIPAIAILAEAAAEEVDFASIGTNDLCQYMLAVDRLNPEAAPYYQFYNPAVFRVIHHTAEAFTRAGKVLSVCGEMAGNPQIAAVLVGLGIHKLSMSFSSVPAVKRVITGMSSEQAATLAQEILKLKTAAEIEAHLHAALDALC